MTILRSSALSINVLLIFEMHELNGSLFLIATSFSSTLVFAVVLTFIIPFTTIYASLQSHKSDLIIEVLNHTFLLTEH